MLRSFKALSGLAIRATDGRLGTVSDIYFDDRTWQVRYCVVDSGGWFADGRVLIKPRSLSIVDSRRNELWVRLARAEILRSRKADSDKPVSKQRAGLITSIRSFGRRMSRHGEHSITAQPDRHLRSCRAVLGHRVHAVDGTIGRVDDLLIDGRGWTIPELVVDTGGGNDAPARVVVAATQVREISWPDSTVSIALTRDALLGAPGYAPISRDARLCS